MNRDDSSDVVPIGAFCWVALTTPDIASAQDFYSSLFGWRVHRQGWAPFFKSSHGVVGALMSQGVDERVRGQPPHWMPFVCVTNLEESVARAEGLGGQLWLPPTQGPLARVALVRGVTSEIIGLWERPTEATGGLTTSSTAIPWFELVTPNPETAKQFYRQLFGWRFDTEGSYTVLTSGSQAIGGVVRMQGDWEDHTFLEAIGQAPGKKWDIPPHWMVFFRVDDCNQISTKAEALGGRISSRPEALHTFGHFAVLRDPQSAYFSVLSRV